MRAFTRIQGATSFGAEGRLVDVQVAVDVREDVEQGTFRIVGLPDHALREGRERIRSAIHHAGWAWHAHTALVNLAPAGLRKEGASLDLAIAVGLLGAMGALGPWARVASDAREADAALGQWLCLGELTLDGAVRPVRGVLAAAEAARRADVRYALVPRANAAEAAAADGLRVFPIETLAEAVEHLSGRSPREPLRADPWTPAAWGGVTPPPVRGQPAALLAGWIATAGGHNLLLSGPPGSGKTLLARHMAEVMPPFTRAEALATSRVWSIAGLLDGGVLRRRPFRAPHHSTSIAGLVGGGRVPAPGEASLAHGGVLFLDELAEFSRHTLEALRQPIEAGEITIGRAAGRARFPCRVLLVAATNPCPCGWRGVGERCTCESRRIAAYRARISGPLRDRFDLQVDVRPVDPERLVHEVSTCPYTESQMRGAWSTQAKRAARLGLARPWNAELPAASLPDAAEPEPAALRRLIDGARRGALTGRGIHRCLRVARTVADLEGATRVGEAHVAAALGYRSQEG